jgi:predicted GNAT family N-acyltransferase
MDNLRLLEEAPTPKEYANLRRLMGWGEIDEVTARKTVEAAIYSVCLRAEDRLVGLARVVGDGVLYFYIADVIVHPELRGGGYGTTLMRAILGYFARAAKPEATIVVVPLKGREKFYEGFGFQRCPNDLMGAGMHLPYVLTATSGNQM